MKSRRRATACIAGLLLSLGLATAASAGEVSVTMAGARFSPARLQVRVGDTIRFINDDTADHNVFVPTKGFAVDIGKQEPGKVLTLRVSKQGRFEVECVLHEGMSMIVEVVP